MMKEKFKRILVIFLVAILCMQCLTGCSVGNELRDTSVTLITEKVIEEEKIKEEIVYEKAVMARYIKENITYDNLIYEYQIGEEIISQAYILEVVVNEHTAEDILSQLPEELEDYDIDWGKIIGKFAIGTTVIIAVGIVHHVTNGATFFVFGSPTTVAKDALIAGAMAAAIDIVFHCISEGKMPSQALTKHAIEGFADGYMWGAIESATKRIVAPQKLKFANGLSATIKKNGTVVDKAGKSIGKAFYDKGKIYVIDNVTKSTVNHIFDTTGKEAITNTIKELSEKIPKLPANTTLQLISSEGGEKVVTDSLGKIFRNGDAL